MLDSFEGMLDDGWRNLWKRLAFVCRYGHIGLEEALRMPLAELHAFAEALNELLEEERASIPSHDD